MIIQEQFYNIVCDCCGTILDEENWHADVCSIREIVGECNWREVANPNSVYKKKMLHFCPECSHISDDDNLLVKDGRQFEL